MKRNPISTKSKDRGPGRPAHGDSSRHDALLAAAQKYFLVKQYRRVTTREIAAVAGVDIGLIGYYFHNKEGLYKAMLVSVFEQTMHRLWQLQQDPPPSAVRELFDALYGIHSLHPDLVLLTLKTLLIEDGPSRDFLLQDIVSLLEDYVTKIFTKMRNQGMIADQLDPLLLQEAFTGLCLRPFQTRPMLVEKLGEEKADEYIRRLFRQNAELFEKAVIAPAPG